MAISLSLLSACASGRQLTKPEMETAGRGRVERIETLDPIKKHDAQKLLREVASDLQYLSKLDEQSINHFIEQLEFDIDETIQLDKVFLDVSMTIFKVSGNLSQLALMDVDVHSESDQLESIKLKVKALEDRMRKAKSGDVKDKILEKILKPYMKKYERLYEPKDSMLVERATEDLVKDYIKNGKTDDVLKLLKHVNKSVRKGTLYGLMSSFIIQPLPKFLRPDRSENKTFLTKLKTNLLGLLDSDLSTVAGRAITSYYLDLFDDMPSFRKLLSETNAKGNIKAFGGMKDELNEWVGRHPEKHQ